MRRGALLGAARSLALVPAAAGHLPTKRIGGYVSTVSSLEPDVLGVQVAVLGGDERLRLANLSGKTIVILGEEGQPLLRFTKAGVARNTAVAGESRRWAMVATIQTYEWDEPRISWNAKEPPPAVRAHPEEAQLIRNWSIPARADREPFAINGFLGYAPPLGSGSQDSSRLKGVVLLLAVTLLALGLAFVFYLPRRTSSSRRSP